jgi:hypothetical protein
MIVTLQFNLLRLQNPDSSLCVMVYCIQENEQIDMVEISTALVKVQDRNRKRTLVIGRKPRKTFLV